MFNITGYVRAVFRDAALGGIQDAMTVMGPEADVPADLAEVRARFAATVQPKALTAGTPDSEPDTAAGVTEPAKGKRAKG